MKHKFTYSAKRADEEGRGRAIAEARIASIDAGKTGYRQEYEEVIVLHIVGVDLQFFTKIGEVCRACGAISFSLCIYCPF